jgi:hypothetical protein
MIALSQVQGALSKDAGPSPFVITPEVAGRWRWMSTVAAEFIPADRLIAGTLYKVGVPAGIESVAGDTTAQDFSWSFETLRPEVTVTDPSDNTDGAGPSSILSITFNREIDLDSATKGMTLHRITEAPLVTSNPDGGPLPMMTGEVNGTRLALKALTYGKKEVDGKMVTDKTTVQVAPKEPFAFSTRYALAIGMNIRGTEGELGTKVDTLLQFSTVGPLGITSGAFEEQNGNQLRIVFTNPMDAESLKNIVISPKQNNAEMTWEAYDWAGGREAVAYPTLNPSTTYTVTVGKNVKDKYGQTLKEPFSFTFKTNGFWTRNFLPISFDEWILAE